MPETRKYLTDIPYEAGDSEYNRFCRQIKKLIGMREGDSFSWTNNQLADILRFPSAKGNVVETNLGKHNIHFENWWCDLLHIENLNLFEELLKTHKIAYVRNIKIYGLCCDETTKESESIFSLNHPGENLLFISSPTPLYRVKAIAYATPWTTKRAKELERNISEKREDRMSGYILDYDDLYPVHGIYFKEGACQRCYGKLERELKEKAAEITAKEKLPYKHKPKVRILVKEPVLEFNKRYFTS